MTTKPATPQRSYIEELIIENTARTAAPHLCPRAWDELQSLRAARTVTTDELNATDDLRDWMEQYHPAELSIFDKMQARAKLAKLGEGA